MVPIMGLFPDDSVPRTLSRARPYLAEHPAQQAKAAREKLEALGSSLARSTG